MKAKQKTLVVLLVLALLAGIGFAVLTKVNSDAAGKESDDTVSLTDFTADALDTISYTVGTATVSLEKKDGTWRLAEDTTYHISQTMASTMVTSLCGLSASRTISDVTDYAQYGTDAPALIVTASAGKTTKTFLFGATNEISNVTYLQIEGDTAVYAVSSSASGAFQYDADGLYDTAYSPISVQRTALTEMAYRYETNGKNITVSLKAEDEPVVSSGSSSESEQSYTKVWYLADGRQAIASMVSPMLDAAFAAPTAQITAPGELARYGLEKPALTLLLKDDTGKTQTLSIGIGTDGCYLQAEGDDSVYAVSAELFTVFGYGESQLATLQPADELDPATVLENSIG